MPAKKGDIHRPKAGQRSLRHHAGEQEFESLITKGVRKFILEGATMGELFEALQSVSRKSVVPPHKRSAKLLSQIVRELMEKRKKTPKR